MQKREIFSGVYEYSFKNGGKMYIGSSVNLYKRDTYHLSALKNQYHTNKDFQQAFNKFGIENLQYRILEYVENSNYLSKKLSKLQFQKILFEVEQKYLDKFYAQEYLKNTKDLRFFKYLYNKSVLAKYAYSELTKDKQVEIHKYDLDGNYIESYYNSVIAGICNNIDSSSIRRVCQNKGRKRAGKFIWSYEKLNKIENYKNPKFTAINQFDKNKNFIKRYESITQAKIETGVDVRKESNGKTIKQGGFYWLFDNESFKSYKRREKFSELEIKEIKNLLEINSEVLKEYRKSGKIIKDIANLFNCSEQAIRLIQYGLTYKTNGFPTENHKKAIEKVKEKYGK